MQWSDAKNGGFSAADETLRPMISAIQIRNQCPEFGFGGCEILDVGDARVFAHRCCWEDGEVVVLHNFADQPVQATVDLTDEQHTLVALLSSHPDGLHETEHHIVDLEPFGYR